MVNIETRRNNLLLFISIKKKTGIYQRRGGNVRLFSIGMLCSIFLITYWSLEINFFLRRPRMGAPCTKALKQCEMKRCAFGLVGIELSKFVVQLYNETELMSVRKVVYFL